MQVSFEFSGGDPTAGGTHTGEIWLKDDNGDPAGPGTVVVDYGDGSPADTLTITDSAGFIHTWAGRATYTMTVTLAGGNTVTKTFSLR